MMTTMKPVPPFVFARYISRIFPANIELNVVIDFAVIDQRAPESCVFIAAVILATLDICGIGDEMVDWDRLEKFTAERPNRCYAWLIGA